MKWSTPMDDADIVVFVVAVETGRCSVKIDSQNVNKPGRRDAHSAEVHRFNPSVKNAKLKLIVNALLVAPPF
jgi:hypothetical protein